MTESFDISHHPEPATVRQSERRAVVDAFEELHADALSGESYEDAAAALASVEAVSHFRSRVAHLPFGSFFEMIETATTLNALPIAKDERRERMQALAMHLEERAARFSPRVADIYRALCAELSGESYTTRYTITADKIAELRADGDVNVLFSSDMGWDMKLNRIETRLAGFLSGLRALDLREGKEMDDDIRVWRQEQLKNAPTQPPHRRNESMPGVDPMERLPEGERVPAIWIIEPGFDAMKYFEEQCYSMWDESKKAWVEDAYQYSDVAFAQRCTDENPKIGRVNFSMNASVSAGVWTACAVPYTHGIHRIDAGGRRFSAQQDQNGNLVLSVDGKGDVSVTVHLSPKDDRRLVSQKPERPRVPTMIAEFTEETEQMLKNVRLMQGGTLIKARALAAYVGRRVEYLAPKDRAEADHYNTAYRTHARGFAGAVDEIKKADCDVANTYFATLCARLNIPVMHAIGHSVNGRDESGESHIDSGTGHGWSKVWDDIRREWMVIDATPSGDPNLEDKRERGGRRPFGYIAGDAIEREAVRPSDEKLEALVEKLANRTQELSYTKEERELAKATGIKPQEARAIVREIQEAESARLSNGELAVEVMGSLFDLIVESRKRKQPVYSGPVRRSEGGERIMNLIRHYIGVTAGETDPMSRERPDVTVHEEKILNGMDVYVIGDKSGSVFSSVSAESELLWQLQRRFAYLLFSALYRFDRNLEKAHLLSDKELDVRTMAISFRDEGIEDIDEDKPLSSRFTAEDKVRMWHSLATAGSGNGDCVAMQYLHQTIKAEKEQMAQAGIDDTRLRIVIAYSDGGYVGDDEVTMRAWAEEMSKLGVVIVGIGLTESAASVPVVMHNPPKSFGEVVSSLDELVIATLRHIVIQAIKLFPAKAREDAEEQIAKILYKFEKRS